MGNINKVKIGGVIYDIVKTNKVLKDEEEDVADGVIDFRSGKIFISNKISKDYYTHVLLHEIFHGIVYHFGINEIEGQDIEEEVVDKLARAMHCFLKDNKELNLV